MIPSTTDTDDAARPLEAMLDRYGYTDADLVDLAESHAEN